MGAVTTLERRGAATPPLKLEKQLDLVEACMIVECSDNATPDEWLDAWAYLIRTRAAWTLQGWYGRNASHLIDDGWISRDGRRLREV